MHSIRESTPDDLEQAFAVDRRFLGGLCYRMTGSVADAEDIVQETFLRALERPPADTDRSWRPWLTRVAVNLSRDHLRRRRRRGYVGPWLPGVIATEEDVPAHEPSVGAVSTEGRYDLVESVSIAFLLALEALTPTQRAVLLLRDVFDYDASETAMALGVSVANVKTTLHRARRAMRDYDRDRCATMREAQERTREALARFLECLAAGDGEGVQRLLHSDAVAINDGGGEFRAARQIVRGRDRVARLNLGVARHYREGIRFDVRTVNGLAAVVLEFEKPKPGFAPRSVLAVRTDAQGSILAVYSIMARAKLASLQW